MILKQHKNQEGQVVLAICDEDIIGKKYEEGKLQLDLTSNFYKGESRTEEDILKLIPAAHILNLVGQKSVDFALKHKLIEKEHIITIADIPHAQCVVLH